MTRLTRDELDTRARTIFAACGTMTREGLEKAASYCAQDVYMEWPFGPPEPLRGREAFVEFVLANAMEFELTLHDVFVDEEQQTSVLIGSSSGRNPRTGLPYSNRYVLIFRYKDGLITEWYEYLNPVAVMEALG